MALEVHPITVERKTQKFDLFEDMVTSIEKNHVKIENGDVIVISSKYISNAQGRIIDQKRVRVFPNGQEIATKYNMPETLAEIVSRESDQIFGGISGFVMSSIDNILAPNAGIDKSNSKKNTVILYPNDPYQIAEELKRKIFLEFTTNVGIIIVDSRLLPSRVGTVGVAISCAGIEPINDMRAQKDLDGNPLKVTMQAIADGLATIANHTMGEGAESRPYVIIKKSDAKLTGRRIRSNEIAISHDQCVYVRSLKN